jgi:uncharacterized protein (TIGR02246 family)
VSAGLEARVRALEAREAVRDLLGRYVRAVDAADREALPELFAPDATWVSPGRAQLDGIDEIVRYYSDWFDSPFRDTRHHVCNVVVEVADDARSATADGYYLELASYDDLSIVGFGSYRDVCRCGEDGRWEIAAKVVEILGLARLDEGWAAGLFAAGS